MSDLLLLALALMPGALAATAVLLPPLREVRIALKLSEERLASALKERQSLRAELDAAQDAIDRQGSEVTAENAELRRRMDELADLLMAQAGAAARAPDAPPR